MSKPGADGILGAIHNLSPHLGKASARLASFFRPREMEPEDRLAIYVRLLAVRREIRKVSGEDRRGSDEGPAFRGYMIIKVSIPPCC